MAKALEISFNLCQPRQSTVTPGLPSDFWAKKPPSLAIQMTTSETDGVFFRECLCLMGYTV